MRSALRLVPASLLALCACVIVDRPLAAQAFRPVLQATTTSPVAEQKEGTTTSTGARPAVYTSDAMEEMLAASRRTTARLLPPPGMIPPPDDQFQRVPNDYRSSPGYRPSLGQVIPATSVQPLNDEAPLRLGGAGVLPLGSVPMDQVNLEAPEPMEPALSDSRRQTIPPMEGRKPATLQLPPQGTEDPVSPAAAQLDATGPLHPPLDYLEEPPASSIIDSPGQDQVVLPRPELPGESYPEPQIQPWENPLANQPDPFPLPSPQQDLSDPYFSPAADDPLAIPLVAALPCDTCAGQSSSGCWNCGSGGQICYPDNFWGRTRLGRFLYGVQAGICCPDPCYQPQWTMLANASFFSESARPQTRQRFRWDYFRGYPFVDSAEYVWASANGLGPAAEPQIDFHDLTMYVETGSEKFSFFVATPYRSAYLDSGGHYAGFSDIQTGTKTLLHDTSLVQLTFQFKTYLPTASPGKGLGTGHVSLEPGLLLGIQLTERSFLQAEVAEWIPIGGDPDAAGALLRYSTSYNRRLFQSLSKNELIATIEYSGLSFQDGNYTDPVTLTPVPLSSLHLGRLGSGLRFNICDKINFGAGVQVGLTDQSPEATFRTEIQFQR